MKKIATIICVLFALVTVLALPVSAATPYQTYTYSINGTALHSPAAYTPMSGGNIDAIKMGLTNADLLCKYHSDLKTARDKGDTAKYNELYGKYSKLDKPSDIETDADGNVYIADSGFAIISRNSPS